MIPEEKIVERIHDALSLARAALEDFIPGRVIPTWKTRDDPVTAADLAIDDILRETLPEGDEGWLSEETRDGGDRLGRRRVWVVDPIDGTREFVAGIGEFAISIGYVEDGRAVAGGIANPYTGEVFIGALGVGVTYQGEHTNLSQRTELKGATILASRTEVSRGEWDRFRKAGLTIRPMGSIAYKLARVAAGLEDATWTLRPKHEWDVAGGVALVEAAGGMTYTPKGSKPVFNKSTPRLSGLIAHPRSLKSAVQSALWETSCSL